MTKRQGYQNSSAPIPPAEGSTRREATPAVTSADPENPLELDIRRGTPAVDMRSEIFGRVWGVTDGFCVIRTENRSFVVSPWEDMALGHVQPARGTLTDDIDELDRLNYYAATLREIDYARHIGTHPWHRKLPPALHQAHQYLTGRLRGKGPGD